ncbi:hypothetical protein IAQ61_001702 [Plenodomus lingam]|uniref:uncharacterized protein n=1 Tax=Leptosphaeria maculans TaxID=5022 RepID=UPI00331D7B1F|nr:hypothetical protein IAQ61_001702 [Plenodomus lingam]
MKDRNTPISWSTQGTLSIHAHKHDKRPDFYKEIVDKILAGWIREVATTILDRQPALVLQPSSRRTCVFGPHVPQTERPKYLLH